MVTVKDTLLDMLEFTSNEFFECVKIVGTEKETNIFASDGEPTLILNAKTKEPQKEFNGTLGLGSLQYLKGLANFKNFRTAESKIKVVEKDRNGKKYAEMFVFEGTDGAEATYRLMHESALPEMPVFKGTEWDIEFSPTKEKVEEFSQLAGLLGDIESQFTAKMVKKNLVFFIGEEGAASHKAQMVFAKDINGDMQAGLKWPMRQMLYVLRTCISGNRASNPIMRISNKGVACISVDSGLGSYDFYIVAKQK